VPSQPSQLHFHHHANDKVLLVCPFSSKQELWFDLKCVNVHDGKQYRMRDCNKANGNIAYNVVFPSQFAQLLIPYQQHPEAKSLEPDGTQHGRYAWSTAMHSCDRRRDTLPWQRD